LISLTKEEAKAIDIAVNNHIPFGITPYYAHLMDQKPNRKDDHAVRAQVIPPLFYAEEMAKKKREREHSFDFMMEHDTSPIDLVVRRYPKIAIFKPYNTCSQICVYCQRNWEIDEVLSPTALAPQEKINAAIKWFKDNPEISEVLITGGDAFIMSGKMIDSIMAEFAKMDHIKRIRLGTRTPVVLPQRVTDELIGTLKKYHKPGKREVCVVTHFEHVYEISPESVEAVQKIRRAGMSVYNQLVFTIENSRRFEAVATRRLLKSIGVDLYYTFVTKGKEETREYRVPIARLLQEQKEEARLVPGMERTDEVVYNMPRLGKNYLRAWQHHDVIMISKDGSRVVEFHPWEKNISLVDTYLATEPPIYDYLQKLKARGEKRSDYQSIWYYF